MSNKYNNVLLFVEQSPEYWIFGAQIAYGAYKAIYHFTGQKPEAFLVSNKKNNPAKIEGIPVTDVLPSDKKTLIVVAVTSLIQKEVLPYLKENGFDNLFVITDHEEYLLMSAYYNELGIFPCASDKGGGNADLMIFEAHSHKDKPLAEPPQMKAYEKSVHAGAALGKGINADFEDNSGDNISGKNKQYCETTVTYWVWKNVSHEWVGIEHYRRHILVTPEMLTDDVDAVLTLPYMFYPDGIAHFRVFASEEVLSALQLALKTLHPEEYDEYDKIIHSQYQCEYNIVCAKKEVFDAYCEWFFEITEYMETMSGTVSEIKETRALSYVAEVLTNLYFMYHRKDLNIRYAEKKIYI